MYTECSAIRVLEENISSQLTNKTTNYVFDSLAVTSESTKHGPLTELHKSQSSDPIPYIQHST